MSYADVDVIAKLIPKELKMTIEKAIGVSPKLKEAYESSEDVKTLLDTAMALEGIPRNTSTHAAGVVITNGPVSFPQ